jgi:CheY-like chemotaxis protein
VRIRRAAPGLPILVMSGYAFRDANGPAPDFFRMAIDLGAAACLRKPFTRAQLLHAVQACALTAKGSSDAKRASGSRLDHDLGRGAA